MLPGIPEVFPFLKRGRPEGYSRSRTENDNSLVHPPSVKFTTDRTAYRPGDVIVATIEITHIEQPPNGGVDYLVLENLVVEIKGLEKLDPQWLVTPAPARGSKQRRGERTILESSPTGIVSDVLFEQGAKKTYLVRTVLPKVLPPSYKGTVVRYLYYFVISLQWAVGNLGNGHSRGSPPKASLAPVEIRSSLNIWTRPSNSGLAVEDLRTKDYWGIVPQSAVEVGIYWKEKDDENDWTRASEVSSEIEDDYVSQTTESMLPSPVKGKFEMSFDRALLLQSPKASSRELSFQQPAVPSVGLFRREPLVTSTADTDSDVLEGSQTSYLKNPKDDLLLERRTSLRGKGFQDIWQKNNLMVTDANSHETFSSGIHEHELGIGLPRSPSGSYARGRSYNIRLDDQILARFSPRNPDSTYYFGDVVGGVLSFHHEESSRKCLEISAVLETREELNPACIHPSRRNSLVITKVQADYHEVVVDTFQTHFLFTIPFDGPPSFATPQVALQWVLRFEFVASPCNVNWSKYDHPLIIEEREKGEWSLPIFVHAPLPRTQTSVMRKGKLSPPRRDSWGESSNSGGTIPPLILPPPSERLLTREHRASSSFNLT